jgi:hypothetical protein
MLQRLKCNIKKANIAKSFYKTCLSVPIWGQFNRYRLNVKFTIYKTFVELTSLNRSGGNTIQKFGLLKSLH